MRRWMGILGLVLGMSELSAFAQDSDLSDPLSAELSTPERLALVRAALAEMDEMVTTGDRMIRDAQAANKAELVRCLNAALGPVRTLRDVSQRASNDLNAALAEGDSAHADLEFRKIVVARDKAREYYSKAVICGGTAPGPTTTVTQSNVTLTPEQLPELEAQWELFPSPGTEF
ncbi:MAG TPA: hypothetical protein PLA94_04030 [Myxococcota bacterium]|nr:hypothetical protein [Myxococcota bacterium]HND29138.1 hypothetical protein [Myxococcota bacterium]